MQEAEKLTYDFSIYGIGFIKSLNKKLPKIESSELKENIGNVSLKFLIALESKENKEFADNIRKSYDSIIRCNILLKDINCTTVSSLEKERIELITKSETLITKLKGITEKIIY